MYIELHLLQSFPPSNLNRDDTNNPKDCTFGGVRRARISSQCLKRAIRTHPVFVETTRSPNGIRTKKVVQRLLALLGERGKAELEALPAATAFVHQYMQNLTSGNLTDAPVFLAPSELTEAAEGLLAQWDEAVNDPEGAAKRLAKEMHKRYREHSTAPDVAMFGRMMASQPELGLEAACQVAHALSTHRISMEMDYFTAVDDLQPREEPGANMIGYTSFNSACFYRYARIDWDHLVATLDDASLALRTVEAFLRASEMAVPSGKQNSFAHFSPPSLALAVVRDDGMSWSLVNAFEQPVTPDREGGYVAPSVERLDSYWGGLCAAYGTERLRAVAARTVPTTLALQRLNDDRVDALEPWLSRVLSALSVEEATA
jgi:CRISPR system Cascade subunit CasC